MRTCLFAFSLAFCAQAYAAAPPTPLREPVFLPFDVFSGPRHLHLTLQVKEPRTYQVLFNLKTASANSPALMAFARQIRGEDDTLRLSLPAHLTIAQSDGHEMILDQAVERETLYASNPTELSFRIQAVRLEKGDYEVDVDTSGQLEPIDGVVSTFGLFVRKY